MQREAQTEIAKLRWAFLQIPLSSTSRPNGLHSCTRKCQTKKNECCVSEKSEYTKIISREIMNLIVSPLKKNSYITIADTF
jgi:hypothetical protein